MAESDYTRVAGFPTERLANAAVQDLILKGIGAVVEPVPPEAEGPPEIAGPVAAAGVGGPLEISGLAGVAGPQWPLEVAGSAGANDDRFRVMVVPTDRDRACEILGAPNPDASAAELDRVRSKVPPLRYLVPAILGALVGIPLLAFYLTYKLSGG